MSKFRDELSTYYPLLALAVVAAAGLLLYGLGALIIEGVTQDPPPTEWHASLTHSHTELEYGALNASPSGFVLYAGFDRIQEAAPAFIPALNQQYQLDCPNPGDTTQPEHVITCLNRLGWQIDQYVATGHLHRYVLKRATTH